MRVTARDVAKEAGVSPATVSLVFRNKPGVGRETRKRVMECAQRIGFEYDS
jgi:LacI family transcriptional regulator